MQDKVKELQCCHRLLVQLIVGAGASLICVFWLEKELNANVLAADGCGLYNMAIFS